MDKKRDTTIDILRSIAIALMVSANMAIIIQGDVPWLFRLSSSLAAPIFIVLAMMMVIFGFGKGHGVVAAIEKCIFLVIAAILLDISNELIPFKNIDVLYLIGLSLIFVSLVGRLSIVTLAVIMTAILCLTPYLQTKFGYQQNMLFDLTPTNLKSLISTFTHTAPHRYLIDGWFPLFPWLAIVLFGAIIGKLRYGAGKIISFAHTPYVCAALTLIVIGGIIWWLFPGEQWVRYNFIELFYLPMSGFMLFAMGIVLGLMALIDYIGDISIFAIIHPLGEASLFMYLFHIVIIDHIILPLGSITFNLRYFIYFLILITVMIGIGILLRKFRKTPFYRKLPHFVRWIVG